MKPSEMFLHAAKIVDVKSSHGGCAAIVDAAERPSDKASDIPGYEHFELFKPALVVAGFWWGPPRFCNDEERNARIIGLLLAREMAKDAGQ